MQLSMPPKGKGRARSSSGREWNHPDGMDLSEIDVDAEYDGVITNVGRYGVFVDFGAVKDAILKVTPQVGRGFTRGMEVKNLSVVSCDLNLGRVVLSLPDDTILPEAKAKRQAPRGGKGAAREGVAAVKDAGRSRKPRDWSHSDAIPLEDLQEGDVCDGVVTNVSPFGTFVDIGAVRDARLAIAAKLGRRFRIGDIVPDCRIEVIDLENGRIGAVLDDAEEVMRDLPPKERAKAKAAPKRTPRSASSPPNFAVANPGAKAKARVTQASPPTRASKGDSGMERLRLGQLVDGVVSKIAPYGVFVDIGCGKDAKLMVPRKMMSRFQKRDEIIGMRVESIDLERRQISVSIEDPELEEEVEAPPRQAAAKTKAQAKPKAKEAPTAAPKRSSQGRQQGWSHPGGLPASSFEVGGLCDGVVTNITSQGAYVDIGGMRDAVLNLPREISSQCWVGDEVHGMTIEAVDLQAGRVTLSLEEPELEDADPLPTPQRNVRSPGANRRSAKEPKAARASSGPPSSKAKENAQGKAKAKAKTVNKQWSHADGIPLEQLEVGSEVSGVVTNRGSYGVFLDIGAVKDGKLKLGKNEWKKFEIGDEVEEMIIDDVDLESEQISLALTFELGDAPEEVDEEPARAPQPKAKTRRTAPSPGAAARAAAKAPAVRPAARPVINPQLATAKAKELLRAAATTSRTR